ncbi:NAD-dependent histone deacetylase sir2 [Tulasnella sp. 331]|nr:NAD-dependent histone deacetylase sir2 [Tulasnella sp. 331]
MSETDEASRTLRHQLVSKGATVINNTGRVSGLTTPVALKEQAQEIIADLKERGLMSWLQEYVIARAIPIKELLITLDASKATSLADGIDDVLLLPLLKTTLTRILRKRDRLVQYSTVEDVVTLLRHSKRILVLTGAGISVSCGIPDFRSSSGLYALLNKEKGLELDDPQQMFDIQYFKSQPEVFYSFARFIKALENHKILLRNYTQNIDTLESKMGIHNVLQCHGSFATAYCLECLREVPGIEIEQAIFAKQVPFCEVCMEALQSRKKTVKKRKRSKKKRQPWEDDSESDTDVVATRPSQECITFFGEAVTSRFDDLLEKDRAAADLLLVIGTSLKVAPVSEILTHLPHSVPQILINKTPVKHVNPDIVLLGNADEIIVHLCQQLGWELPLIDGEKQQPLELVDAKPKQGETSQVWLFNGAEPGTTNATERLNALVKGGESLPAGMEGYERPRPLQTMASSTIQVPESSLYDANPYKRSRQS